MACPTCGSTRTIVSASDRRKCLAPEHEGPRTYNITREVSDAEVSEAIEARQGWAPEFGLVNPLPMGQKLKGTSTLTRNAAGEIQWVKTNEDNEAWQAAMLAVMEGLKEEIPRALPVQQTSTQPNSADLLNCYVITDFHMGALSWEPETGADWNVALAEKTLVEWFRKAIEQSPAASTAMFAQLSDFLHWDGFDAVTPASKHLLDADTRFPKLVRTAIRVLRAVIDMLLQKHDHVHIVMADANHDPASQIWLREWMAVFYENEPRVTVDTDPSPYNAYEFGNTALFIHHGHKKKIGNVSEVFAAKYREMFGRTKYAYAHTGHLHHIDVKENNLMIVEQHRTLAAPDAYAARGGWLSGRDAKVITYSRKYGEVGRLTVSYDMVKELVEA